MKNIPISFFLCLLFAFSDTLSAQEPQWHQYLEQLAEEEGMDTYAIDHIYSELLYLESNPMDLNSVQADQLTQFPLLSAAQVTSLVTFLEKNRPIYSVYELRNVPTFNFRTVQLILPFFIAGEWEQEQENPSAKQIFANGRHDLQLRFDKTVNQRAGYKNYSDSILEKYPNRKYRGEDFYTSLRYVFKYRNKLQAGITAEKDAGEPFLREGYHKGYDHYGMHLLLRDAGPLSTLVLGDYRLSFGQGLILNNDFGVIKSWGGAHIARRTKHPRPHTSTAEAGFFRGIAAVVSAANVAVTTFYSYKKMDANISKEGHITSFKLDGLHRTPLEIEKKRNTAEQVTGLNIDYRKGQLQMGISAVFHAYNRMYNPVLKEYNRYYLRNSTHCNASIDYSYQLQGFLFAGETAIDRNKTIATLNLAQYRTAAGNSYTLLYRNYPISYNALHGQAFSEGTALRNERGIYLGAEVEPFKNTSVNSYISYTHHPYLKYNVNGPSSVIDCYTLAKWSINNRSAIDFRYKYRRKQKNITIPDEKKKPILPYTTLKIRIRWLRLLPGGWDLRSNADWVLYKEQPHPFESGFMLSQGIGYRSTQPLSGDLFLAYFNADGYNARLYSYERNLLNTFYMPSFYGKGMRAALSGKYTFRNGLSLSLKMGHTHYLNRDTIGQKTEQITGNKRTDLWCYLRWKF